ncbi:MAG TPA: SDR family NAD(P)-dependent oxidoreductase [Blastocatellia bacterium]|jgi:NAD(P)-dependent dehydrogenase (short-subunit alcohol dehydrogenase family)|nr:SDR family NAD(P)-dependent oxidoreductase [Blastocatellia bacterium]
MKLDGKVSIVTGAGQGIGRRIALRFAAEGAAVTLAARSKALIDEVADEIRKLGGRALTVVTDVADEASIERMVRATLDEFGAIDVLVNNAGIAGPTGPATKISREDWDQTLAVNLTGAWLCAKHALPAMIERRSGRIINITSVAGLIGYALRSPYAASKWAMIGLTQTLAQEVGGYNITVNAVAPGPVRGPRIESVIRHRAAEMGRTYEEVERDYVEPLALKRMVEEDDIAAAALFLASEDGRNITGETIEVSGGYRLM